MRRQKNAEATPPAWQDKPHNRRTKQSQEQPGGEDHPGSNGYQPHRDSSLNAVLTYVAPPGAGKIDQHCSGYAYAGLSTQPAARYALREMVRRRLLITLIGASVLAACNARDAMPPNAASGGSQATAATGTVTRMTPDPRSQPVVDAVLKAASTRLNIPAAQLRVERVESREWNDSSLGCPQPGMMYAQVITPGYLVVVAGGGKRLEYHTDTAGRAVLCKEA